MSSFIYFFNEGFPRGAPENINISIVAAILITGVLHGSLPRCFYPGLTPRASCHHSLTGELNTSRPANYSAEEDLTHLPGEAACNGIRREEDGPGCPLDSQRGEMTPVAGTMVTNWSSWAATVKQLRRVPRQFPEAELSPEDHLG